MDKEKTVALVLLDLCAFACFLDGGEDVRSAFETAYRLAEERSLPGIESYRDLVRGTPSVGALDGRCKEN
jgi:hypothetical protein